MQTVNNNKPEQINSALFAISDDITKQNIQTRNEIKSSETVLQKQIDKLTDSLKNNGGLITGGTYNINISGNASTATKATNATNADKATQDSAGNTITTTYATKTEVPTKTSQLTNDSSFVTSGQLAKVATTGSYNDLSNKPTIPTNTNQLTNGAGYITSSGSITGNAATATKANKVANALTVNGKTYNGSSAVNAGVQTIANGGTGVTTQADINKAFISNLEVGESDVTDGTEFVSSYASNNGFSEPGYVNTPLRRKFSVVWNYIKGKISSVLGLTKDNYGGTAATATRTTGISYTGESYACISAQQSFESFNNSPPESWASYIICNHIDGETYYHQMLRLPFFSDGIQLQRRVKGNLQGWKNVAIIENSHTWSGKQTFTGGIRIPTSRPSSVSPGDIWIE